MWIQPLVSLWDPTESYSVAMGHRLAGVTNILRTSHIQSLPSVEMSLTPRSTSLTQDGRRQKQMSSYTLAI